MRHRHKKHTGKPDLPRIWLMTDPRLGGRLLAAVRRLPAGSGVVFRHYELEPKARRALFRQAARICRQRGHILLLAADERMARGWGADGFHGQSRRQQQSGLLHSASVHNASELAEAQSGGADILFISPLYATRSHPGERTLGVLAFRRLALLSGDAAIIALGGMNAARARMQDKRRVYGWAAIDAFGELRVRR